MPLEVRLDLDFQRLGQHQKGTGEVFQEGAGWVVRWREGNRRRYRSGFKSRDVAQRVLEKVREEIAQGRAGMPPDMRGVPALSVLAKPFLERRKATHAVGLEDGYRWEKHLAPHIGHLKPGEVDTRRIRAFIEAKLAEGVNPATVRIFIAILSSLFADLVEQEKATVNPCRSLPRSVRRLMKPTHDPCTTPFIEKLGDVWRIFLDLPEPLNAAYAVGALAGLRTGEVFALQWQHVDLEARRIHVRESVKGPLKDRDSRMVPILDALLPILNGWKLKTGGKGRVIPPLRCDGEKVDKQTPGSYLRETLGKLKLAREGLGWYEATRHTFAPQWMLAGGSIEKLKEILGHYSVVVTEKYAHLRPDLFPASDLGTISIDLRPGGTETGAIGQTLASSPECTSITRRHKRRNAGVAL